MKQPERVAELLAELRALAETDFERHRIDVLEQDLTAPPQVEVIDDTHQRFNGETYLLDRTGHHRRLNYLHRIVWNYCYGEIPLASEIHHVDGNSLNNNISNLQIMTGYEHKKLHRKHATEVTCPICGKIFANSSHGSKYCSRQCAGKARQMPTFEKICLNCGKTFTTNRVEAKYCSFDCYAEACGRLPKHTCPICEKIFSPKTFHQIYCSPECKNKALSKPTATKKCAICGKIFIPPKKNPNKKCCSPSCSRELTTRTQKSNKQQTALVIDTST
ncbi:MAG: HNH endonuclease [Selenomonadaceae bacterium]|nr:HNH endonuclease [Selenomonadaceae bacterium]MBR4383889.1 HNH endonuclease [Selenomonadaceae bacterium]